MLPDTGTAGNHVAISMPLLDKHPIINGPRVTLPNGDVILATHTRFLKLSYLSKEAKLA